MSRKPSFTEFEERIGALEKEVNQLKRNGNRPSESSGKVVSVKSEISFADGVPVPPNVRPVIILKGSDYEMGYQYFQQLVQIFGIWVPSHRWSTVGTWKFKRLHREKFTKDERIAIKSWEHYIKKHAPEFIDILKGMVAGARDAGITLTYEDLIAHFAEFKDSDLGFWLPNSTFVYRGKEPSEMKHEESDDPGMCSGLAAWGKATKDGKLICAGSSDDNESFFSTTIIAFPETGNNFIYSPYSVVAFGGFPCHPGMNNKGLAWVHHGGGGGPQGDEEPEGYTVPRGMAVVHILRFASNAKEALKMHLALPRSVNFIKSGFWADVGGNAVVCERRYPKLIREAGYTGESDFLYATNNRQHKDNALGGEVYIPHGGWVGPNTFRQQSVSRNLQIWNMLHNYHGEVDLEFVKMMYRFSLGPPDYPTLEEADAAFGPSMGAGWQRAIGSLKNGIVGIMQPDDGEKGLYHVSTFCPGRKAEPGSHDLSGHNYPPAKTYSFYQLNLASNPEDVVKAAEEKGTYDLYYANTELGKLNYRDHGYVALDDIFNQAATEYYKGHYCFGLVLSGMTSKNESVFTLSKALRAFTRCQAYARKIYNALVSPATTPEELGLRGWFGDWGEWATSSFPGVFPKSGREK